MVVIENCQQYPANDWSAKDRDTAKYARLSVVAKRTRASRTARHPKTRRHCRPTSCAGSSLRQLRTRSVSVIVGNFGCPGHRPARGSEVFARKVCSSVKSSRKLKAVSPVLVAGSGVGSQSMFCRIEKKTSGA